MVQTTQIRILNDNMNKTNIAPIYKVISLNIKNIYNSISKPKALKINLHIIIISIIKKLMKLFIPLTL